MITKQDCINELENMLSLHMAFAEEEFFEYADEYTMEIRNTYLKAIKCAIMRLENLNDKK